MAFHKRRQIQRPSHDEATQHVTIKRLINSVHYYLSVAILDEVNGCPSLAPIIYGFRNEYTPVVPLEFRDRGDMGNSPQE